MMKKLIALFLALCMVCAMIPALAETAAVTEVNAEELLAEGEAGDWAALLGGLGAGEGEERGLGDLFGSVLGGFGSGEEGGLGDLFGSVLGGLGSGDEGGLGDLLGSVLGSLGSEEGGLSGLVSSVLGSLFEDGSSLSGLVNSLLGSLSSGDGSGLGGLLGAFLGGENADLGTKSIVEGEAVESEDLDAFLSMLSQNDVPAHAIKAESAEQFFDTWKLVRAKIGQTEVTVEELGETAQLVLSADSFSMKMEEEYTEAITTELADGALVVTMEGEPVKLYLTDAGELVLALGFMDLYFAPAAAE